MPAFRIPGLSVAAFLRDCWQKRPLLVRGALPQCGELLHRDDLFELAERDDLESRLVLHRGRRWQVRHGPFERRALRRLPRGGWTLLVQGVNHALPAAQALLGVFSFIPYARLDDLMASYAPDGGGVGPHFDHYDVFLLQGDGRRRWRISRQRDLALLPGAPLRILRRFRATQDWTLSTGDLLYLPPRVAHDGTAAGGACITYSVGFRAPDAQELALRFLEFLQERVQLAGMIADPGLRAPRHPARLGNDMVRQAQGFLERIRWGRDDVAQFLGRHLTEPKPHVRYARPARPLARRAFAARAARDGVRLALATRMLFRGDTVFINGEALAAGPRAARQLARLADRRALPPQPRPEREVLDALYPWYRAGYIQLTRDA